MLSFSFAADILPTNLPVIITILLELLCNGCLSYSAFPLLMAAPSFTYPLSWSANSCETGEILSNILVIKRTVINKWPKLKSERWFVWLIYPTCVLLLPRMPGCNVGGEIKWKLLLMQGTLQLLSLLIFLILQYSNFKIDVNSTPFRLPLPLILIPPSLPFLFPFPFLKHIVEPTALPARPAAWWPSVPRSNCRRNHCITWRRS